MNEEQRIIGITMGDPSGIGPEIILKSFNNPAVNGKKVLVIGDYDVMKAASGILSNLDFKLERVSSVKECTFSKDILNILDLGLTDMKTFQKGVIQPASGNAAFRYIKKAVSLVMSKEISAIATAPLNKEALHFAGHNYPGHTEILAGLTGTRDYTMLLHDRKLSVIHVSTHISLLDAIKTLNGERIEKVIEMADTAMRKLVNGVPRIAVAGLNPHAGENGLFGMEEKNIIAPAVKKMKQKGFNVEGPVPPDTVFLHAVKGKYDIVVAMYHDQGHIPLKLLGFDSGVNITVGLPFVRTSVDHGTAFEIAWQGIAREDSMTEAIRLAWELSK
ncbi:MAG TPA: 4-hydroxythreonine-4-phosphate dehydrogenase PdxA [Bacteroidales bacterium]|nr:4-hydroxythreonine-4-phosphate dehydrogenase PdxA [Bacteroidales bacterium]